MEEVPEPVEQRNKLDTFSGRGMEKYAVRPRNSAEWKRAVYHVWGEILEDFWRQNSGSAGDMQLPLVYCYVQGGYDAVVVRSEDTNVIGLRLAFSSSIDASLFQKCDTQTRTKLIDICKVVATIGEDLCMGLVGLRSFTWRDTVSAFAGIALKIARSPNDAKQAFTELDQSWDLLEDLFRGIKKVTCSFYSTGTNASDVNDLRYNHFFAKNGDWVAPVTTLQRLPSKTRHAGKLSSVY